MLRAKSETLTAAELPLMDLTTLRILERKGYVRHQNNSRAFQFIAVVDHRQATRSAVSRVVSRFFRNSPKTLVLRILEDQKIAPRLFAAAVADD